MTKILCGALTALAVCGVAAIAYETGKGKGYAEGLRESEKKPECDCENCTDQKLCRDLEAEGEAIEPADKPVKSETVSSAKDTAVPDDEYTSFQKAFMED